MPTDFHFDTPSALATVIAGADLQNLPSGSGVLGPEQNNEAPGTGDLEFDFQFEVAYATGPPAAGTRVADLYIIYAIDGTNYPSVANTPEEDYIDSFISRNGDTSTVELLHIKAVPARPYKWKAYLRNVSGVNFKNNTSNVLRCQPTQFGAFG